MASTSWEVGNLAHRYTASFFKSQYGDDPEFIMASAGRANRELIYYNIAGSDSDTESTICAGLLISYMEAQGIPYHSGNDRGGCFSALSQHLKQGDGTVLATADIVDESFRFFNE